MNLGCWTFTVAHTVEILNNTPKPSGFTPKETFVGIKGEQYFRNYHAFGSPTCFLDPSLQAGKKISNWKPRSKACVFVGK